MGRPMLDYVTHHEEVVGKSFLLDDTELQIESRLEVRGDNGVAPTRSFERQLPQLSKGAIGVGHAGRNDAMPHRDGIGTPFRNLRGGIERLRAIGKVPCQVIARAEPRLSGPDLVGGELRQGGVQCDGRGERMTPPLLRLCRHYAVRGDHRESEPARHGEHRMSLPPRPELGIKVLRATEPEYLLKKANITGEENESI